MACDGPPPSGPAKENVRRGRILAGPSESHESQRQNSLFVPDSEITPDGEAPGSTAELTLTRHQEQALERLLAFTDGPRGAFVLTGSAGTGKTTLLRAACEALVEADREVLLLAPTGRAARVLQQRTGFAARTAHSHLYTPEPLEKRMGVRLIRKPESDGRTDVIVIDEASLVAAQVSGEGSFVVANSLLDDLMEEADRHDAHIVFVGDPCQLPPVGEPTSYALQGSFLADRFRVRTESVHLHEVLRHAEDSDILTAATVLRDRMEGVEGPPVSLPHFAHTAAAVADYVETVSAADYARAVMLAYTNRTVFRLNERARRLLGRTQVLCAGDLVITDRESWADGTRVPRAELFEVTAVDPEPEFAGLRFAHVEISPISTDLAPVSGLALLDTLEDDRGAITAAQEQKLWAQAIDTNPAFKASLRTPDDPHVSAFRLRYGYALTVHKAQGGEWDRVYLDPFVPRVVDASQRLRWQYTALTRAARSCFLVGRSRL